MWLGRFVPLGKHITKLIFTILSGVAEVQLTMILERTSKALRHYQANGRRVGGWIVVLSARCRTRMVQWSRTRRQSERHAAVSAGTRQALLPY
jgi:hypothetical protein